MKPSLLLSFAAALLLFQQTASAATPTWTQALSGPVDGASYGDVDGDGTLEMALVLRGNPGEVVLLSHTGEILWTYTATSYAIGFPTFGDFDGNGTDEIAYCENGVEGSCRVLNGDGTLRYSVGPYYHPGMTGSGPSAADITGDGADDIIITSWGGEAALIDGKTGSVLWTYDAWELHGEVLFGPSTVADLDGDGNFEVVLGGWMKGTLFVLDAATGAEVWTPIGLYDLWGNYFYGNGALVEDLDGDGTGEVVVSLDGDPSCVAAFSSNGQNLWRTTVPASAWFAWLTPVATDLDRDGSMEVLAQSADGVLFVLDADGGLVASPSLGAESWIAPGFMDLDFDLLPEIVAANVDSLLILDGRTFAELDRHDDAAGGLYPQILVGDLGDSGEVNVVAASWYSESVNHFSFPAADVSSWSAFGGGATHTGGVELVCPTVCASPDASVDGSVNLGDGVLIGSGATVGSGTTIGDDTIIGSGATVEQQSTIRPGVTIGDDATIEQQTYIGTNTTVGEGATVGQESLVGWNVTIGDDVSIDQQTIVWSNASIGEGTTIAQESRIGWGASIGEDVDIGQQVVVRANASVGEGTVIGQQTTIGWNTVIGANVTIGEGCRIGSNVVIGDGVIIPDGTRIRSGSVLP